VICTQYRKWFILQKAQIKPVSELRNNFLVIENTVNTGTPLYLTKNGCCAMVVLSFSRLFRFLPTERIEEINNRTWSKIKTLKFLSTFRQE